MRFNHFGTGQGLSTIPEDFGYIPVFVSIPLEQDWVFRQSLQFDERIQAASQSFWNRARSFDFIVCNHSRRKKVFQSLQNRAGSFDLDDIFTNPEKYLVSIPLEQGRVFRLTIDIDGKETFVPQSLQNRAGSFDLSQHGNISPFVHLNPFRTGQGLSTASVHLNAKINHISIPLEQGRVFRLQGWFGALLDKV